MSLRKYQDQTAGSQLIWVLFVNKHGKKLKYKFIILYIFWNFSRNC